MKKLIPGLLLLSTATLAAPIPKYENIQGLLEGSLEISSLEQISDLGLNAGETALDLWSGSYWPHYQGALASRYRDPQFATLIKEKVQYIAIKKLFSSKPIMSYANTDDLSPAEKYDLLVGDQQMTLTNYSWEVGKKVMKGSTVSTWRGLCDGWASASQKMPRPVNPVTLETRSGAMVTFFPEDIKALGTLLYARAQKSPIFLGKRCFSSLLSFTSACDEVNPGAFHKALVNRVGSMKKSFIGDISPGGEVWNYPVKRYEFTYTNVFDETESKDFKEVMEAFNKKDKKKKFSKEDSRHKATAYIVGVRAKVIFQNMRENNLLNEDGSASDSEMEKIYEYDLELDRNFNILGGVNADKDLPDFIWAPNDATYPLSIAEEQGALADITEMAKISSKEGQPLAQVVEKLFEASK